MWLRAEFKSEAETYFQLASFRTEFLHAPIIYDINTPTPLPPPLHVHKKCMKHKNVVIKIAMRESCETFRR